MLKTIGIREAKAHFSEYIAMAHEGNDIVVTDRGRPVVRLVGIKQGMPPQSEDEILRRLEELGVLEGGSARPLAVRRAVKLRKSADVVALVRAQRR
jgi:prevent-host-death family protein